jgi:hypothetical protein
MFIFRITRKTIDHFEVFPGYAIRRRFFRKKHNGIEVVCQDHLRSDDFLSPADLSIYKKIQI